MRSTMFIMKFRHQLAGTQDHGMIYAAKGTICKTLHIWPCNLKHIITSADIYIYINIEKCEKL